MMQKILRVLEANVEWIALAIAVGYLGWMAYSYLWINPVSSQLEGETVSVGNVDEFIDTHAAERLRDKMSPDTPVPNFTVDNFPDAFRANVGLDGLKPTELASGSIDYQPFEMGAIPGEGNETVSNPVLQLPALPAAEPLAVLAGLDTVSAPPGGNKDIRVVVAAFTIPWSKLYDQWNKAFGPAPGASEPRLSGAAAELMAVTAYRSEKIDGNWVDDPNPIPILNGGDLPTYPKPGDKVAESAYREALSKESKSIATPDLPTSVAGVTWKDPLQYLPGAAGNQPGNPGAAPGGPQAPPPPPANDGAMDNANPTFVNTQYGPGGGPGGGGFGPGGPRIPLPPIPPPQQPQQPTAVAPADGTVDPKTAFANPDAAPSPTPVYPNNRVSVLGAPTGPDLCLYIIDETAKAGMTYRYRIVYKMFNPLYNKPPMHVSAQHKNWIDQFDLTAPLSEASPEITLPQQTYLFCSQNKPRSTSSAVSFDIFTWSDGKWQKDSFDAGFGDPIGGVEGNIDYSTGYILVDKHTRGSKTLVTIVDQDGNIVAALDSNSPDYQKANQWLQQQTTGTAPTAPPSQGGAPAGGPPSNFGPGGGPPGGDQ